MSNPLHSTKGLFMKQLVKLEELALFLFSIFLFSTLSFSWWLYPALLLAPDLSMIGYSANTKVGAIVYNLVHHRAWAYTLIILGAYLKNEVLSLAGIILVGHSSLDRVFDYGFKYGDNFKRTHLTP